ncbi:MAG: DUF6452 family protein [Bacteroidota bacterium]
MRKLKIIVIAIIVFISFSSCEKDDICDENTSTTPRIIIEFYDALNPSVLKNITNLKVTEIGSTSSILFTDDSKIAIPLKTNLDTVKFELILNSTSTTIANTDYIEFNYTRKNVFVSRACGYKTIFTLTSNPLITDKVPADEKWIQSSTTTTFNIETENETHIKIYI